MWRKPLFWLPLLLATCFVLLIASWGRQAKAEITTLRAPHPVVWKDFLGVNAQFHFFPAQNYEKQMTQLNALGLEWVRIAMHWALLEPRQGEFNLNAFDAAAKAMQAHKLRPVGFLAGSAPFASSAPQGAPFSDQYPPKDNQLYSNSLLRFAERYPSFEAWQIWNEPNIYPYWRPSEDAEAYGKLLFTSADALRAKYPEKTIVAAGMAYFSQMPYHDNALMLQSLLQQGVAQKNLVIAYHPYTEKPEGDDAQARDLLLRVQFINNALRANKIDSIWATEWGWSSYDGPKEMQAIIGQDGQADFTLRRLALMSALDFDRIFLFTLSDLDNRAGPRDQHYGLLDLEANPKPVYLALKNFLAITGPRLAPADAPTIEESPNDLYSIAWQRDDGSNLWMFWSASGKNLRLPKVGNAQLYDPLTGKHRELTQEQGKGLNVPVKTSLQILVWK